jgi:hypothetical protein
MPKFEPLNRLIKTWRVSDIFQGKQTDEESGDHRDLKAEYDDARRAWIVDQITQYDTDLDAECQEAQCAVFMCETEELAADQFGGVVVQLPDQEEDDPSGEMAASGTQDNIAQNVVRQLEDLMDLWRIDESNKRREALTKQQEEEDESDRQIQELLKRTFIAPEDYARHPA